MAIFSIQINRTHRVRDDWDSSVHFFAHSATPHYHGPNERAQFPFANQLPAIAKRVSLGNQLPTVITFRHERQYVNQSCVAWRTQHYYNRKAEHLLIKVRPWPELDSIYNIYGRILQTSRKLSKRAGSIAEPQVFGHKQKWLLEFARHRSERTNNTMGAMLFGVVKSPSTQRCAYGSAMKAAQFHHVVQTTRTTSSQQVEIRTFECDDPKSHGSRRVYAFRIGEGKSRNIVCILEQLMMEYDTRQPEWFKRRRHNVSLSKRGTYFIINVPPLMWFGSEFVDTGGLSGFKIHIARAVVKWQTHLYFGSMRQPADAAHKQTERCGTDTGTLNLSGLVSGTHWTCLIEQ